MFSSSVDGSMSKGGNVSGFNHHHNRSYPVSSLYNGGGGGILMRPLLPLSFSSGGKPPLLPLPTYPNPYSSSPLPITAPNNNNNKRGRRALSSASSSPPTNKKPLPSRKPSKYSAPPESTKSHKEPVDNRLGPEPSDLPKQVSLKTFQYQEGGLNSIFRLAPPPSSLPLPKFFLKPKLVSCNVEAVNWGGRMDDDGATATDNLRRLLGLC